MRKVKNAIVKLITLVAFLVLLFCITAIDTEGTSIFYLGALVSAAWLFTFAYANGYFDSIFTEGEE